MFNAVLSLILGLGVNAMAREPFFARSVVPMICFVVNAFELALFLINRMRARKAFVKVKGMEKLKAQLRVTRWYPYPVFFAVTMYPVSKGLSVCFGIIICLFVILEYAMLYQVKGEIVFLKIELTKEDAVIIVQSDSCLKPTSYRWLLFDNLISYLLYELGGQMVFGKRYKGYVFVNNITALVLEDMLREHKKSLFVNSNQAKRCYGKGAKPALVHALNFACENILYHVDKEAAINPPSIPYPDQKIHYIRSEETVDFTATLVSQIENASDIPTRLQQMFSQMADAEYMDEGKRYLAGLLKQMLSNVQKDTEYFYDLMKICEFMVHYKSLADYERAAAHYFDGPAAVSFGTLAATVLDGDVTQTLRSDTYKEALRFVSMVINGTAGDYSKKRPAYTGRMRMVNLRNRYVGHGTMTYSVSEELTKMVMVIVHALCEEFLYAQEPLMIESKINGKTDKYMYQDSGLYLLTAIYDEQGACQYIDYATGMMLTAGNTLTIRLDR